MTIDKATKVRDEDALDIDKISEFIAIALPDFKVNQGIEILQFPSGASNLTYEIKGDQKSLILRTSPAGANIKSAHDMGREYRVLSSLISHFPYCPMPLAFSDDKNVLGRDFYVMEKVEGIIPRRDFPVKLSAEQHTQLCKNLVDVQVKLHAVDIVDKGLIELGKLL